MGLLTPDRGRVGLFSDFAAQVHPASPGHGEREPLTRDIGGGRYDLRQRGGNGSLAAGMLGAGL